MSLVGKKAPAFKAPAIINGNEIVEEFSLEQYLGEKEVILFFYTKDFSFLCPTEITEYQRLLPEFEKRKVAVVGISTDTEESHLAWLTTPRKSGGIEGVTYPLVADTSKTIASNFGVLGGDWDYNEEGELIFEGAPVALRGTFLIDKEGFIRHEYVNFFPMVRNVDDSLRTVDAWHRTIKSDEHCTSDTEVGGVAGSSTVNDASDFLSGK